MIDCSAAGEGRERTGGCAHPALAAERGDRAHAFQRPKPARTRKGELAFASILSALRDCEYAGDACSIEPFVYQPDGPTCAARGIGYIRGIMQAIP